NVIPDVEPLSGQGEQLVKDVRATPAPFKVQVAGMSAQLVDSKAGLLSKLPIALLIIASITFVLMFLMFGSVVVPAKAVVLNLLSLSATFGAMVWIFQEGHLAGRLLSVVFHAFATSEVSFIKLFGIGLALAVLMDAFVIRGLLVPSFMRLAGEVNWWAPPFLRRVHNRVGIREHIDLEPIVLPT